MKKIFVLSMMLLALSSGASAQEVKYQLSSHILDITQGKPAANVKISLSKQNNTGAWTPVTDALTDKNGRINSFLKEEAGVTHRGIYKLTFFTEPYFKGLGQQSFYPFIEVVFELNDSNHYHVPITVSPFGYSTYRGS